MPDPAGPPGASKAAAAGDALRATHLGPLAYADGVALQERLVAARAAGGIKDWLIYPDHPPVLTVGRGAAGDGFRVDRATLERRGIEVHEASRGGDVTWHGPGQLVGYPIVDLSARGRDLHAFLRSLEQALITSLGGFGIAARFVPGRTGVWVGERKIASLGIAVRRWVSYHGFALNVAPDLRFFDLIHPCGLRGIEMTSMARLLGEPGPALDEVREVVTAELAAALGYKEWCWAPLPRPRTGAGIDPGAQENPPAGVDRAA